MYAIFLGPVGFGLISQLYNFYLLFTSTVHLGIPVAVTSEISKLSSENDENSKAIINSYFRYFVSNLFYISLFITAIILFCSAYISDFLVDDKNYYYVIAIIFISAPFSVVYFIIEAFLRSYQRIGIIVKIGVISNILSIIVLIPLIIYLNLLGVSIYLLLFGLIPVVLLFFFAKDFVKDLLKDKGYSLSRKEKNLILKIGSVSLLSSLIHQGIIILIRKVIISTYGYDANGIYQSVLSVSYSYFGLLYIFLTNYSLPKLSGCKDNVSITKELNMNARFLLLIMIPLMIVFYGFKDYGILLLFSKNFLNARELFFPQFLGDIFRVGAALFGLWLIPRRKIWVIIVIDIIFNIVLFVLSYIFISVYSLPLIYVSFAYMVAFTLHFIMYFVYTKIALHFKVERKVLITFLYSILAFMLTYFVTEYINNYEYLYVITILGIWFILVIERNEITQMKAYLQSVYKKKRYGY